MTCRRHFFCCSNENIQEASILVLLTSILFEFHFVGMNVIIFERVISFLKLCHQNKLAGGEKMRLHMSMPTESIISKFATSHRLSIRGRSYQNKLARWKNDTLRMRNGIEFIPTTTLVPGPIHQSQVISYPSLSFHPILCESYFHSGHETNLFIKVLDISTNLIRLANKSLLQHPLIKRPKLFNLIHLCLWV